MRKTSIGFKHFSSSMVNDFGTVDVNKTEKRMERAINHSIDGGLNDMMRRSY